MESRVMRTDLAALRSRVEAERSAPLDATTKGVPARLAGSTSDDVSRAPIGMTLMPTPLLTIDLGRMRANIAAMAEWTSARGVELQPHGKTSMSPAIWLEQLEAGATGITVANEAQLRVAIAAGVPTIQLANMVADPATVRWIADRLTDRPELELLIWVDSTAVVELMSNALADAAPEVRLSILLEIGMPGGRTGVRSPAAADEVLASIAASGRLDLVGISGYEGVAHADPAEDDFAEVDAFLGRMRDAFVRASGQFATDRPILTAGGSTYFDRVVASFASLGGATADAGPRVILRSGAYVVHDDAYYEQVSPSTRDAGPALRAAMHAWGRVVSRPEPELVYVDLGKRDVPFDISLPVPQVALLHRADGPPTQVGLPDHRSIALNDQHLGLAVPEQSPLQVGDLVRLGIAHPCTAFDKWALIATIDDVDLPEPSVTGYIRTHF